MRSSWAVGLLILSSLLTSCVTTASALQAKKAPDVIQRRVQTWLGLPRDFLEKHWGIASKTEDMGLGLRFLQYKAKSRQKNSCAVVFTVDITGTVRGGQWSGDRTSCLSFVKEVPSSKGNRQDLVSR